MKWLNMVLLFEMYNTRIKFRGGISSRPPQLSEIESFATIVNGF